LSVHKRHANKGNVFDGLLALQMPYMTEPFAAQVLEAAPQVAGMPLDNVLAEVAVGARGVAGVAHALGTSSAMATGTAWNRSASASSGLRALS
jgi:hypothetical protein